MNKFKISKSIAIESWAVLKKDKEMLWFPILSAALSFILTLLLLSFFFFYTFSGHISNLYTFNESDFIKSNYLILFLYYVLSFFIVNFFQAAVFFVANARFNEQNISFRDGVRESLHHSDKIFLWSLISATVGIILGIISDKSKTLGKILSMILGATWSILTYFSLPSLVIGHTTVVDSFKESAYIIRKTWGETIILNLGAGLFFSFLILPVTFFTGLLVLIIPQAIVPIIIIFILVLVLITSISSTLSSIFKLALYHYARTGNIPEGFSEETIGAIKNHSR